MEFRVSVEPDTLDGGWVAECLDLPGCLAQGDTEDEALESLGEAMGHVLAARLQLAHDAGHDTARRHEHRVAIAL